MSRVWWWLPHIHTPLPFCVSLNPCKIFKKVLYVCCVSYVCWHTVPYGYVTKWPRSARIIWFAASPFYPKTLLQIILFNLLFVIRGHIQLCSVFAWQSPGLALQIYVFQFRGIYHCWDYYHVSYYTAARLHKMIKIFTNSTGWSMFRHTIISSQSSLLSRCNILVTWKCLANAWLPSFLPYWPHWFLAACSFPI